MRSETQFGCQINVHELFYIRWIGLDYSSLVHFWSYFLVVSWRRMLQIVCMQIAEGRIHPLAKYQMKSLLGQSVCGDPMLQFMCTVLVLFSNVPCKTCVGVEVFAPVSVFWVLEALEQLPMYRFLYHMKSPFFRRWPTWWGLFCRGIQFQSLWSLSIDV